MTVPRLKKPKHPEVDRALASLTAAGKVAGARSAKISVRVDPGVLAAAAARFGMAETDVSDVVNASLAVGAGTPGNAKVAPAETEAGRTAARHHADPMEHPEMAEIEATLQAIVRRAYDLGRAEALKRVVDVLRDERPAADQLALKAPDRFKAWWKDPGDPLPDDFELAI